MIGNNFTTTFTVDFEPKWLEITKFFSISNPIFYDVDISKYNDGRELWTISITYNIRQADLFASKFIEFFNLIN